MNKELRIKKNEEFSRIMKERHSIASDCFILYYSSKQLDRVRVGISVSKKLGNAVVRNKIKRQVRSMAQSVIDFDLYNKDMIIIVRKDYLDFDYAYNCCDLEKLVKKAII